MRLYTADKNYPHTAQDPTQEDSEYDYSPLTHFIESNPANMSRFEPLEVEYTNHCSDCNSDSSIHQVALNPSDYRNKSPINLWSDYRSISRGGSDKVIQNSAQHWSDYFVLMCPVHEDDKIRNNVYWGELPSSPPTIDPEQGAMEATMDMKPDRGEILSPRLRPNLSAIKRSLHEALGCTSTNIPSESPECPVHQARRPSPTKPLY